MAAPNASTELDLTDLQEIVDRAIAEDVGDGDITSLAVIGKSENFEGVMAAREPMVVAGLPVAAMVFEKFDPAIEFQARATDGDRLQKGAEIAFVRGPAVALLAAERTAINFVQHLSGIATLARIYADEIAGTGAVLLDTRKTIPGLRKLAKYATRMGGATNHRMGLSDGVLIKDNHIAVAGSLTEAVHRALNAGLQNVEVECDTLDQVAEALASGAQRILLDNMSPAKMREAVSMVGGKVPLEASGNVTLETIREIAETGVDFVSVGRLTHSAAAANIGLDWSWA